MSKQLEEQIIEHVKAPAYQPQRPRTLAKQLNVASEDAYPTFRDALRQLMHEGRVILGARGAVVLPTQRSSKDEFLGVYRHNKRGFGFVVPTDPTAHEDLFIPPGENSGAITGDIVRAKIISRGQRDGKAIYSGRIIEVVERKNKHFVGSVMKVSGEWLVFPDGNALTDPILTPDAASRHLKPGTKVVVELTTFPDQPGQRAQGVITEVLGNPGEKDVDLRSVIVQFHLPEAFPDEVKSEARNAVDTFDPLDSGHRLDLTKEVICTIDPDDAKDYDDAISLSEVEGGYLELGVHIADVSYFVRAGTALDTEARERGNSTYFPGFVIPMLPEILSNGVCSLQEAVPRLCKSAFITLDEDGRPIRTRFANSIIKSRKRLRYTEAQDIIDGKAEIRHPEGNRKIGDYSREVVDLLGQMNQLALLIQKRRRKAGQLVLDMPEVDLVLDEEGKVVDTKSPDTSFTHTIIEMFMVEANEAVARLLDSLNVPFLRRIHPDPDVQDSERLRHFAQVTGHKLPKEMDRHALQMLLEHVRGKPEAFSINLAVLKSLTRAEYSPEPTGHYALASEHYSHFTSPIRRYADLTIHRLLDSYFEAAGPDIATGKTRGGRKAKVQLDDVPSHQDLVELGKHISFTERRSEDAERELRQVKILELLKNRIGEEFNGVVTGITNFGIFVQLGEYLVDGLIRYEALMDDWWEVDERSCSVRGQRSGKRITIGNVVKVYIARVDVPRRELDLAISEFRGGAVESGAKGGGGRAKVISSRPKKNDRQGQKSGHGDRKGNHKRGRQGGRRGRR